MENLEKEILQCNALVNGKKKQLNCFFNCLGVVIALCVRCLAIFATQIFMARVGLCQIVK